MTEDQARLEIAYEILQKIFGNLCHDRKIAQAEKLMDIMRQLLLFSQTYGGDL